MSRDVVQYIERYDPGLFPEDLREAYGIDPGTVANLASNELPFPPPPEVQKAIADSAQGINRYPDPSYRSLTESLSDHLGIAEDHIAVAGGCTEVLDCVCKVFLEPFDQVTIPIPSYSLYILMAMLREARISLLDTGREGFRLKGSAVLPRALESRVVFLCSPNNPTGQAIDRGELTVILEAAEGAVVVDEAYAEFTSSSALDLIDDFPNLLVARSMSKAFGLAGMRVGYLVGDPAIVADITKVRNPFSISSPAVAAALAALSCLDNYRSIHGKIIRQRERLRSVLSEVKGVKVYPSEGNFLMLEIEPPVPDLVSTLARRGILVRDLEGVPGLEGQFLRVTIGTPQDNDRLTDNLIEILDLS